MSTLPDTTAAVPVSIEQAEEASACLGEQVARVRQVVADYIAVTGAPAPDNDNG